MNKLNRLFFRKYLLLFCILFVSIAFPKFSFASIQIDSIKSTISTCPNNGSITVFAVTNAPAILYSIIAGPVTQPMQTSNQFNSLPPGFYTIRVINAASETATQNITVTGNYLQLEFNPLTTSPYCHGGSDGLLVGNLTPGSGNGPYTWELIAPSPMERPVQVSDSFFSLTAGNYTVRVTDACGSFRTIVATVPDLPATDLTTSGYASQINIIGCDSAMFILPMLCTAYRFPLTCTFETTGGTFTTTTPTKVDTSSGNGYFNIQQLLTPFTYGNYIRATITDACGNVAFTQYLYAQPFNFCSIITNEFSGCDYNTHITYDLNAPSCWGLNDIGTLGKAPFVVEITDLATNLVVNKDTIAGIEYTPGYLSQSGIQVPPLPANNNYSLSITDSCGNLFTTNFFIPVATAPPPKVNGKQLTPDACVDSVGLALISISDFSVNPAIIFLSGPALMGSTKPGYEYTNTHVYPDTITEHGHGFGSTLDIFFISGLSVGTYRFKVIDSCGAEVFDSLIITAADVTNFSHRFWYKKGCLGQNEIHYAANNPSGVMTITNLTTNTPITKWYSSQDWGNNINDSILNLPSGTYAIGFSYYPYLAGSIGTGTTLAHDPLICQQITDTIVIEGYQTPTIKTNNSILCNNTINIQLIPDSNKGVPPYQYEIISGPQTFPVQNSNIFTVNAPGTYTARIYDVCGNASTTSITADTLTFPPLLPIQSNCNSIQLFYGSAGYYSYIWTGPNNQTYSGDTLSINPITAADTGVYHIARMVDINGCTDTVYTAYRLTFPVTYNLTKSVCAGDSVLVGNKSYAATGIYSDTLTSINGCDSVMVLNLTVLPNKKDSLVRSICVGQSFVFGSHAYAQTGIYRDTLSTASCDSIVVLNLTVLTEKKDSLVRSICFGQSIIVGSNTYTQTGIYRDTLSTPSCDSIVILNLTVLPEKKDSLVRIICFGKSISVGSHIYSQTGIYGDTLTTASCDSIVILNLTVLTEKKDSLVRSICFGKSITIGLHIYTQTGIYRDTLSTASCDSIVILNLTVLPGKKDSLVRNICFGESVTVGIHTYHQTGIYRDTLTTASCDSIVVLNLTVLTEKKDSLVKSICFAQSIAIGTHTYNQTGVYRDTLSTAGCDSIVILNLTMLPEKKDSLVRSICFGQSVTVSTHTYNQTGIYRDTLSTGSCDSIVVLNLTIAPIKKDSLNRSICFGQSVTVGSHTYNQTGIYRDTLSTSSCDSIVVLNLIVNPNPPINIIATPRTVAAGGTVQLNTTAGATTYLWSSTAALNNTAIQNPVATLSVSSWIYLQATADPGNCLIKDSIFILVRIPDTTLPCAGGSYIYLPNAFSPNDNGTNDVFRIRANNIRLYDFVIYNRWGEMVFRTKDTNLAWDGRYKGKILPGNYVYMISYSRCALSSREILKGNVIIVR